MSEPGDGRFEAMVDSVRLVRLPPPDPRLMGTEYRPFIRLRAASRRHPHWTNLIWGLITGLAFLMGTLFRQLLDSR